MLRLELRNSRWEWVEDNTDTEAEAEPRSEDVRAAGNTFTALEEITEIINLVKPKMLLGVYSTIFLIKRFAIKHKISQVTFECSRVGTTELTFSYNGIKTAGLMKPIQAPYSLAVAMIQNVFEVSFDEFPITIDLHPEGTKPEYKRTANEEKTMGVVRARAKNILEDLGFDSKAIMFKSTISPKTVVFKSITGYHIY